MPTALLDILPMYSVIIGIASGSTAYLFCKLFLEMDDMKGFTQSII